MGKEHFTGTSAFTHQDDATAPIHPAHPDHQDALLYGGELPPRHELETVVLGPPAFGSPDIRTLGHSMLPPDDEQPSSAPALDPEFEQLRAVQYAGVMSEEQLNEMSKDELHDYARKLGLNVKKSDTKQSLLDTIKSEHGVAASQDEDTGQTEEGAGEDEDDYESQSKADLLSEAKSRDLDVNDHNTKEEIVNALKDDDKNK